MKSLINNTVGMSGRTINLRGLKLPKMPQFTELRPAITAKEEINIEES